MAGFNCLRSTKNVNGVSSAPARTQWNADRMGCTITRVILVFKMHVLLGHTDGSPGAVLSK